MKAQLAPVFDDQGGAPRHLAAAAGGRRHGDQGRHGLGDAIAAPFDRRVAGQPARVRGGDGRAFRQINGRASTHGDQPVARLFAIAGRGGHDHGLGRVGGRLVEHGNAPHVQRVQHALREACRDHPLVRDEQRAADAEPRAFRGQLGERVVAEMDVRQVVDVGHIRDRRVRPVCGLRNVTGCAIRSRSRRAARNRHGRGIRGCGRRKRAETIRTDHAADFRNVDAGSGRTSPQWRGADPSAAGPAGRGNRRGGSA